MNTLSYKTISANKATANKQWVLVDAEGQTLGRLASKVAILLRGKHKTNYTPHADCGDNVVIINGMSKGYAMTGWRIGYMAGPNGWLKRVQKCRAS